MNPKPSVPFSNDHAQRLAAGQACHRAALRYYQLGLIPTCLCDPNHIGVGRKHDKECANPGKVPMHTWKHYRDEPPSIDQINDLWDKYPIGNVGVVLGQAAGMIRVDVDHTAGEALLAQWSDGDLPPTWAFRSSPGCRGLLYAWPRDVECQSTAQQEEGDHQELRLLGNGSQTAMPPSRHESGLFYTWEPGHAPDDIPLAPAPEWLIARMRKKKPEPQRHTGADAEPDYAYIKGALDRIPNDDLPYDTWLTVGMALHSTGAEWAEQAWNEWSQQSNKYDPEKQRKSWDSFSAEGGVTAGTLFHLAGMSRREMPEMGQQDARADGDSNVRFNSFKSHFSQEKINGVTDDKSTDYFYDLFSSFKSYSLARIIHKIAVSSCNPLF